MGLVAREGLYFTYLTTQKLVIIVGCTDTSDPYFEKPVLVRTIPGNKCVAGVTILDGELYVVRSQTADVEVYQVGPAFQPVRQLSVQRLRQPTDIVASQTAAVVYVADAVGYIFVVDPSGKVHSRLQVKSYK